jgi:predicted MPP superfamily phosphohydrolase
VIQASDPIVLLQPPVPEPRRFILRQRVMQIEHGAPAQRAVRCDERFTSNIRARWRLLRSIDPRRATSETGHGPCYSSRAPEEDPMAEPAVTLAPTTAALARARSPARVELLPRRAHSYSVPSVLRPEARPRRPLQEAIERGLANLNRRVYPLAPGRWLRRRLERQLRFQSVPIALHRICARLDGLRIAFLSDLHAGTFMEESDLCRIFERVASEEPDLVCIGGDLVSRHAEEMLRLRKPLELLRPPLGVFSVPGNHEYHAERDLRLCRQVLEEAGVPLLVNAGRRVTRDGASLWIAGVDDATEGRPDLSRALQGSREDEPVVLLSHHPDLFDAAAAAGVDLTLAGHTHGGQIAPVGRALRHTRSGYWAGRFESRHAQLYVGRGVGVSLLPLRIGAPGEVPILRLTRAAPHLLR